MKMLAGDKGFTLVEVILVIVILGILLAVAVPKFINFMSEAGDQTRCASTRGAINSALSVTYSFVLIDNPTNVDWLELATYATLDDSMFATGYVPVCPNHGTITIVHGQAHCSIHGQ